MIWLARVGVTLATTLTILRDNGRGAEIGLEMGPSSRTGPGAWRCQRFAVEAALAWRSR